MAKRSSLRPIRPEDEPQHRAFVEQLQPEDLRLRFFYARRELPRSELARLTQIDYAREMAFIAVRADADGRDETLGVVRAVADPDNVEAEFAIVVRSDLKGRGLGHLLAREDDRLPRRTRHRAPGRPTCCARTTPCATSRCPRASPSIRRLRADTLHVVLPLSPDG